MIVEESNSPFKQKKKKNYTKKFPTSGKISAELIYDPDVVNQSYEQVDFSLMESHDTF